MEKDEEEEEEEIDGEMTESFGTWDDSQQGAGKKKGLKRVYLDSPPTHLGVGGGAGKGLGCCLGVTHRIKHDDYGDGSYTTHRVCGNLLGWDIYILFGQWRFDDDDGSYTTHRVSGNMLGWYIYIQLGHWKYLTLGKPNHTRIWNIYIPLGH